MMGLQTAIPFINLSISSQYIMWQELKLSAYRAVAVTSRKHVTKHFSVAKRHCAQWQWREIGVSWWKL